MSATFLTWLTAKRKADQRIRKQFESNRPKGIV
jgi:hypothetical protein